MAMFGKKKGGAKAPATSKKKAAAPRKPDVPADVYVTLMFVSVGAFLMAFVFLALEMNQYGWDPLLK